MTSKNTLPNPASTSWNSASTPPVVSGVYKVLHHQVDLTDPSSWSIALGNNAAYAYYDAAAKRWHLANWINAIEKKSIAKQIAGAIKLQSAPYSEHNYRWSNEA
jgi:hypothetical protein